MGHTPVTRIGKRNLYKWLVWNLDTGAAFKGPLTIMDVDTKSSGKANP
jgi:serine/threonine protein phosphatase 1